ncbi:glycosyltransferase family 4 protein [Zoogloea sp.]|uniref:MraY family glycosyltransferase n=1 Tax=Zoogloea sp. TaxID=49181 RepID=UPI0026021098|nr:glycosyltransferase family 4 protein [Zoogloea sp.]MDD3352216.1 glycosyltransferase family 4 protein [Zoogloea sp.]
MAVEWLIPVLAFGVAWGVTRQCCRPGSWLYFLDHPNERSLHVRPTPRTGGVGVMAGVLAAGLALWLADGLGNGLFAALGGAMLLAAIGLLDDRRSLPARLRFLVQFVAAASVLALLGLEQPGWLRVLMTVGLVWMANLYNFMDGADGLAGGMGLFGFSALAAAAWLGDLPALALLAASIAAAAAGFLCFNFHPARIFMGDAGSVPLGFLAGALGLCGSGAGAWPLWFPLLVFAPFILDASVTLLQRALRRERVWQAHRTHYYQRLVQLGFGHRRTALLAYFLMAGSGASAVGMLRLDFSWQWALITIVLLMHFLLGLGIDVAWRRHLARSASRP